MYCYVDYGSILSGKTYIHVLRLFQKRIALKPFVIIYLSSILTLRVFDKGYPRNMSCILIQYLCFYYYH